MGGPFREWVAVVRRGRTSTYETLERLEASGSLEVIWDRRRTVERRAGRLPAAPERRAGERRREPPATWRVLGFVLARRSAAPGTGRVRRAAAGDEAALTGEPERRAG